MNKKILLPLCAVITCGMISSATFAGYTPGSLKNTYTPAVVAPTTTPTTTVHANAKKAVVAKHHSAKKHHSVTRHKTKGTTTKANM